MVGVFGAGMVVHFSPKDLGVNVGILETIFGQSRLDCLGNSAMSCRTIDWSMCVVVLLLNLNNMIY